MTFRRGLLFSFGRTGADFVLQFVSNIVLARLLLPAEIGIFSVAVAATAILHALRDFGVSRYLIKEKELTEIKIRTVYGAALLVGWSLAGIIFLGAPAVAAFYTATEMESILRLLSLNFLMVPFGQPALALLRRELRYGRLAAISLAASFIGISTSVVLAMLDYGPFALVYGSLGTTAVTVTLSLLSRPDHVLLLPSFKEWRSVFHFGGVASLGTILIQIGSQAPEILLGRCLGFNSVALFSRGLGLAKLVEQFFVTAVSWVTGAELGVRFRSEQSLKAIVLKVTDFTLVIGWPALIFIGFNAETIVYLLYGPNWLPAVPLIEALCIARGLHLIVSQAPSIYEATGAVSLQLRNEIIIQAASVLLFFIGVQFSLEMVAWLRILLGVFVVIIHLSVFYKYARVRINDIIYAIRRSLAISFAMIAGNIALLFFNHGNHGWIFFLSDVFVTGFIYLLLLHITRHPLGKLVRVPVLEFTTRIIASIRTRHVSSVGPK